LIARKRAMIVSVSRHFRTLPGILTTEAEIGTWVTAPVAEALNLQRPLPNGTLKVGATGEKEDQAG
jgi:hypothetical protein